MEEWLLFLRGPMFRFAVIIAALGLIRELVLGILGAGSAYVKANDKHPPWRLMAVTALDWLVPIKRLFVSERKIHGFLSFLLHVGVIIVPVLLLDHLLLWKAGLGLKFALPSIPRPVADYLTIMTVMVAIGLIVSRIASRTAGVISTFQDYFLLVLIIVIFLSGFSASRPWNPVSYEATMIIHVLAGDTALILVPFTKLAHIVLFPVIRFSGELAWKFPSRTGEEVALTLDEKEVRPI